MKDLNTLIFLNGKLPVKQVVKYFLKPGNFIICADGGANKIKKLGIKPNVILGDLDSIRTDTLNYFRKTGTEIIKIEEQETTDFEKSINYCLENKLDNCIIFGATSTRPDHTINNFSIMKRYYKKINLRIIDDNFEITFLNKSTIFNYKVNRLISFLGFPEANGITTTGLKYPLKNIALPFGQKESTSNVALGDKIKLQIRNGKIFVIRDFELLVKHGLFLNT